MLVPELEQKLSFRGHTRETMTTDLGKKDARYKKLWGQLDVQRFGFKARAERNEAPITRDVLAADCRLLPDVLRFFA